MPKLEPLTALAMAAALDIAELDALAASKTRCQSQAYIVLLICQQ